MNAFSPVKSVVHRGFIHPIMPDDTIGPPVAVPNDIDYEDGIINGMQNAKELREALSYLHA